MASLNLNANRIGVDGAHALSSLTGLVTLEVGANEIGDEGARALSSLTSLTSFDLVNNNIGDDGALALSSLTGLTSLNLGNNRISDKGAHSLSSLTSLTSLILRSNEITDDGARALSSLTNLTSLSLMNNFIGDEGAQALSSLSSLTNLNLQNNEIRDEGAHALSSLTNLNSLNLAVNGIGSDGARALSSLTALTHLNLAANDVGDAGARALSSLTSLKFLDLGNNKIGVEGARALFHALVDSESGRTLRYLGLFGNNDLYSLIPVEVIATLDAQLILAAYRRYRDSAARPLNEAKLLVVGGEAVGKTSLIKYLVNNEPRNPVEVKTAGTTIHEKIETQSWLPEGSCISLNIWDFGGQEIMRGTHRFFLTARSLYLIVLEARREDDRSVFDWLKTVRNRGGDSPVIVVINKCDDGQHRLQIDEKQLRSDYPNIVSFVLTSCDSGEVAEQSIARLRELIAETLANDPRLKHVHDPIPESWLCIKKSVAELARSERVLPSERFTELCLQPPVNGEEDEAVFEAISDNDEQRALLRLLNDLGVVVAHGLERDSPAVQKKVSLLDPNWLTTAIYTLLNSGKVANQGGKLSRNQISDLLEPGTYPVQWHEFILDMMQDEEIGLCFELPGARRERYLIPEALPATPPDYDIWPDDSLHFRFRYSYLPPGLIPRFIVQSHRNITDQPTRWRTGVVLRAVDCRILVRGHRDKNQIDIKVAGPSNRRRSALNVVLSDLEFVHSLNREIGSKALVPLPDKPNLDTSYDHLLKLEVRYGLDHEIDPDDADRSYTVRELLEGVRIDGTSERKGHGNPTRIHMTGNNAHLSIINGGIYNQSGDNVVAERTTPPAETSHTWSSRLASWQFFSVGGGVVAAVFVIAVWLIPSFEWRAVVSMAVALGGGVTAWLLQMNPAYFYRRSLSYFIPAGLLVHAAGFSFDAFIRSKPATGGIRWNGALSTTFSVVWCIIVVVLIWADLQQQRRVKEP